MQHAVLAAGDGLGIHDAGIMQQGRALAVLHKGKVDAVSQLGGVDVFRHRLAGVVKELHKRASLCFAAPIVAYSAAFGKRAEKCYNGANKQGNFSNI